MRLDLRHVRFVPPSVVLRVMLEENANRNEQPSRSTLLGA